MVCEAQLSPQEPYEVVSECLANLGRPLASLPSGSRALYRAFACQELVGGNGTIEQARSLGVHPASSTQPGFAGAGLTCAEKKIPLCHVRCLHKVVSDQTGKLLGL